MLKKYLIKKSLILIISSGLILLGLKSAENHFKEQREAQTATQTTTQIATQQASTEITSQ